MKKIEKHPGCLQAALKILGDKWTPLILRDLSSGESTFSELETSLVGISPRTLSQRLSKLEAEAIVDKTLYCEHPPRHRYQITTKGRELQSVLVKMAQWGERYADDYQA